MTTETHLDTKEIRKIWRGTSDIIPHCDHHLHFAHAIEQAILKSLHEQESSAIRGDSYAGVYAWLGRGTVLHHVSRMSVEDAGDSQSIQEMKKDAERYRYIKKGNQWIVTATQTGFQLDGEELDAIIDSEMEQQT